MTINDAEKVTQDRDSLTMKRIAMVVGKIGDLRALPVLENIKPSSSIELDVVSEIKQIRKKVKGRTGKKG